MKVQSNGSKHKHYTLGQYDIGFVYKNQWINSLSFLWAGSRENQKEAW